MLAALIHDICLSYIVEWAYNLLSTCIVILGLSCDKLISQIGKMIELLLIVVMFLLFFVFTGKFKIFIFVATLADQTKRP